MAKSLKALAWFILWLVASCSSTERARQLSDMVYTVGQTTRPEVINMLGLPNTSTRIESSGEKLLGYRAKADGTRYFIPVVVDPNKPTNQHLAEASDRDYGGVIRENLDVCDVVFVFNNNDILTKVIHNQ